MRLFFIFFLRNQEIITNKKMSDENYDQYVSSNSNGGSEFMSSSYGFNPTLSLVQTFGDNKFASSNNDGSDLNLSNVPSFHPSSSSNCNHNTQFEQSSCPHCGGGGGGNGYETKPPKKGQFAASSCHYMNQPHLCRDPMCRFHGGHQHHLNHLNHQYHHLLPPPLPGLLHPFAMIDPLSVSSPLIPLNEFHERIHHPHPHPHSHSHHHHKKSHPHPHPHHHPRQTTLLNKCNSMQWLIIFNFYTTDQVELMIKTQSDNVPSSKMLRLPCKPVPTIGGENIQFRFQDTPQLKDCLTTFYHQYPWFSCTVRSNSTPRVQLTAAKFKTETFLNQLMEDIKHKNVIDIVFDERSKEMKRLYETQPILETGENVKMQLHVGPSNVGKEYFDIHNVSYEVPINLLEKGFGEPTAPPSAPSHVQPTPYSLSPRQSPTPPSAPPPSVEQQEEEEIPSYTSPREERRNRMIDIMTQRVGGKN